MVDVVQLAERQIVVLVVAGSSPVIHPIWYSSAGQKPATYNRQTRVRVPVPEPKRLIQQIIYILKILLKY